MKTHNICKQTAERKYKNSPLRTFYYAECGKPAKFRIYHNRYYNLRDHEPEEMYRDVCKRHLNVYTSQFNRLKVTYKIEEI